MFIFLGNFRGMCLQIDQIVKISVRNSKEKGDNKFFGLFVEENYYSM